MPPRILAIGLLGMLALAACGQQPTPATSTGPLSPAQAALKATYEQQKAELGIQPGDDYEITDVQTGLTYSDKTGFGKVEFATVARNGVATLSTGKTIALTNEDAGLGVQGVGATATCESTTYCPFTRVESSGTGYRKISGDVYLPFSISGLSGAGAVYNYFGMRNTATNQNVEVGLYADYPQYLTG